MKLIMSSDHGGVDLKNEMAERLQKDGYEVLDLGVHDHSSVDYPDQAKAACEAYLAGKGDFVLLFCGTGIGISMAANKMDGMRAANASDVFSAKMARAHNNANALCLGGRTLGPELAYELIKAFLTTDFEGGRHQRRVDKIMALQ